MSNLTLYTSGTILSLSTSVAGGTFVSFGSQVCTVLDIVNDTGADLEYRRGGAGDTVKIQSGTGRKVYGISNADQISLRRVDVSNTPVTVKAEALE